MELQTIRCFQRSILILHQKRQQTIHVLPRDFVLNFGFNLRAYSYIAMYYCAASFARKISRSRNLLCNMSQISHSNINLTFNQRVTPLAPNVVI
jgi:hypothetical protein